MARTGEPQSAQVEATDSNNANQAFTTGQGYIGQFGQNIANLAAGKQVGANPYQSPAYLANEAQLQSSALSGENAAADTALRQANKRSGGLNTGSTQGEISGLAQQKMRLADQLTAQRGAQDYSKNIAYQQFLAKAPLEGAQAEAGLYGPSITGQDSGLSALNSYGLAQQGMWNSLLQGALQGAGAGAGAAYGK